MINHLQEQHLLDTVEIVTHSTVTAAVIWLHGLGADGHDFVSLLPPLQLPKTLGIRFIFPHAPQRPITINAGMSMRAWYDVTSLTRLEDDTVGMQHSCQQVTQLIEQQINLGIPANQIILAGFSQGGVIALLSALNFPQPLGGVLALSSYLPTSITVQKAQDSNQNNLPILMIHGDQDEIIPLMLAQYGRDRLMQLGYEVQWLQYPMGHQVCSEEVNVISQWLQQRLS